MSSNKTIRKSGIRWMYLKLFVCQRKVFFAKTCQRKVKSKKKCFPSKYCMLIFLYAFAVYKMDKAEFKTLA